MNSKGFANFLKSAEYLQLHTVLQKSNALSDQTFSFCVHAQELQAADSTISQRSEV